MTGLILSAAPTNIVYEASKLKSITVEGINMILGIDPGLTGALALLDNDRVIKIWDMPTFEKPYGKGQMVNPYILGDIILEAFDESMAVGEKLVAVIEQVSAMPPKSKSGEQRRGGTASMFAFGRTLGVIEGVLGGISVPVRYVSPQAWKRHHGLVRAAKDASRGVASGLYPDIASDLARKKDVGRADAVLIASALD